MKGGFSCHVFIDTHVSISLKILLLSSVYTFFIVFSLPPTPFEIQSVMRPVDCSPGLVQASFNQILAPASGTRIFFE